MDTNKQNDEIKRIEGYLSKFDMNKVKDFISTILDNTGVYDCKSYHDIAVMIHDDGIDADYLYKSHNRFTKEYGLPKMDIISSTTLSSNNIGYYVPENPLYPFPKELYNTLVFFIKDGKDLIDLLFKVNDLITANESQNHIIHTIYGFFTNYDINKFIDIIEVKFGLRTQGDKKSKPAIRFKVKNFPKHTLYIVYQEDSTVQLDVDELKN